MTAFSPQYINKDDLLSYMRGKVIEGTADSEFTATFLNDMCAKGESIVERDFSKIYLLPFQPTDGGAFTTLPTSTQAYLANLFIIQSAILLLRISFGKDSVTTGANYVDYFNQSYNIEKRKILTKGSDGLYILNPILDLAINKQSYTGQISAPLPIVIDPLAGRNNAKKALDRLPIVDRAIGLNVAISNSPIPRIIG